MKVFWIDLFSGAGGVTTGIHLTGKAEVIACVNHDKKAIESHKANHPNCYHFIEDIRTLDVSKLKTIVDKYRALYPDAYFNLWASLECTNYSKAKGGLPRDADSRTLAYDLYRYIDCLSPDYIYIENVREFMAWGPLDENGKPISRKNGCDYLHWKETIEAKGYNYSYRILNAADYGAFTSRERYFGVYAKPYLPIRFPKATHSKKQNKATILGEDLKPWKPVKKVLDLNDEGESIFTRKKPLVENTLKRIYAGLEKFVAKGENSFIKKYYSGRPHGKVISTNGPSGTVTTMDGQSFVSCQFIKNYKSGNDKSKCISIDQPMGTVTTIPTQALVTSEFLMHHHGGDPKTKVWSIESASRTVTQNTPYLIQYYGNGHPQSVEAPCPTLTTKDRLAKINYLMLNYGNGDNVKSIENPAGTVVNNDKHNLVSCKKFLMNPQYQSKGGSIENPCFTLIARMDKQPPYLISAEHGNYGIIVFEDDCPTMVKIKEFMVMYGIIDIKMRMLKINELLKIQGFPDDYKLLGTQTEQKKFIGNAVECNMAKALADCNYETLYALNKKTA